MGYERSYAIVVSSGNDHYLAMAHQEALRLFPHTSVITPASQFDALNGVCSFLIPTSGSKLGWPQAEHAERKRLEFRRWLRTNTRYEDGSSAVNWVEVQYGDDNDEAKIIAASDLNTED
jgi:hypothetical protein